MPLPPLALPLPVEKTEFAVVERDNGGGEPDDENDDWWWIDW